jgi:quinolinate synthase
MCRGTEDHGTRAGRSKAVVAGIEAEKARLLAVAKTIKTPQARARCGVMR